MINNRRGPIPSELDWLIDTLDGHEERLRTVEAPSGEALSSTVAKLQALVADLDARLDAYILTDLPALVASQVALALAGDVAIGGTLSVAGAVTMPDVFNTNIVGLGGARKTVWVRDGGRMGNTA